jgi:uncharacterized Rmd1/YagE family protein
MKFFHARRTAYHTNPRQIDDVIYTTYSYGPLDPSSSSLPPPPPPAPNATNVSAVGGRGAGGAGTGRRGVKWRSSGSDGETTAATAVETTPELTAHAGSPPATGDLLGVPELTAAADAVGAALPPPATKRKGSKWDTTGTGEAEIFLFSYGTVVIWGMTEQQEKRFLSSL